MLYVPHVVPCPCFSGGAQDPEGDGPGHPASGAPEGEPAAEAGSDGEGPAAGSQAGAAGSRGGRGAAHQGARTYTTH